MPVALSARQLELLTALARWPVPLDELRRSGVHTATRRSLRSRGLVAATMLYGENGSIAALALTPDGARAFQQANRQRRARREG